MKDIILPGHYVNETYYGNLICDSAQVFLSTQEDEVIFSYEGNRTAIRIEYVGLMAWGKCDGSRDEWHLCWTANKNEIFVFVLSEDRHLVYHSKLTIQE